MATFFGEVLPTCSRAVDSESEDDDDAVAEGTQSIQPFPSIFRSSARCIIFSGTIACGFARLLESYFRAKNHKITGEQSFKVGRNEINKLELENVELQNTVLVFVMLNCKMTTQEEFQLTQEMFQDAANLDLEITVLCSCHVTEYKCTASTSQLSVPFVRKLSTNHAKLKMKPQLEVKVLETPNFLTGLPATIMTYSEINNICASTYVLFAEVPKVDSINLDPFVDAAGGLLGIRVNSPEFRVHVQDEINKLKIDSWGNLQTKSLYI